jgi:hypothetical protein
MKVDDPEAWRLIRHTMVARIATLSRNGRPSINPLYFVFINGVIWLGTDDWTLAARNATADPRVSVLFEAEKDRENQRILRIEGQARICKDQKKLRSYSVRVAFKYILTPAGIFNALAHIRQIPLKLTYNAQGAEKGVPCIIEITPEKVEFL